MLLQPPPALQPPHKHTHISPLLSLWEHTGTQMVKPTLVMSGTSVCVEGGLLQMAQRASPISHSSIRRHKGETNTKGTDMCMDEGVGVCESRVPGHAVRCVRAMMAGVDLAWRTKPWHLAGTSAHAVPH